MKEGEKVNVLLVDDQPGKLLSYEAILGPLGLLFSWVALKPYARAAGAAREREG